MGILDKIRKKEEKTDAEKNALVKDGVKKNSKKTEPKTTNADVEKKTSLAPQKKKKVVAKENTPLSHFDLVRKPHISEKAFYSGEQNKYVFRVSEKANKSEVKKAVENLYNVSVEGVNVINVPPKPKMFKGIPGEKSGYKKAIVKLKKGQTIDVIEGV